MIKINKEELRDKIYACWIGKNIGGTMGGPYEGNRDFLDVKGFSSEKGEPLPNDDLDLQLVWLMAIEKLGIQNINAATLGEFWLKKITPEWNEYGTAKANLTKGILPPMSGELFNERWKHSNGAWIRSEIWACLCPGAVDAAITLAIEDAMVDHGMGEGTYAEIFTAALESAAFVEKDFKRLVDIALSKVPADCLLAKAVKTAINSYEKGLTLREARDAVIESVKELGWFQAPANVGFVVLGILYGEGDFKKSMLSAINCGDDVDCTASTVGAVMGIMHGMAGIPADWREYIGDKIITVSIALKRGGGVVPASCTELTDRIIKLVPEVMNSVKGYYFHNDIAWRTEVRAMEFTDGESDYSAETKFNPIDDSKTAKIICDRLGYSYDIDLFYAVARVEFPDDPFVKPLETKKARIRFFERDFQTNMLTFRFLTPEGFTCNGSHGFTLYRIAEDGPQKALELEVTAGEKVEFINRVVVEVSASDHAIVGYIPVNFIG